MLGSFIIFDEECLFEELKGEFLCMVDSGNVENWVVGIYVLLRWLFVGDEWGVLELEGILEFLDYLVKYSKVEGFFLVRWELVEVFI